MSYLTKKEYDPLDFLNPRQQRFVKMKCMTSLDKRQIAARLNVPTRRLTKWEKNEHVQAYERICMQEIHDSDFKQKFKAQFQELASKAFLELDKRFEEPDFDELPPNATKEEKIQFQEKFAKNASFRDVVYATDKLASRLDAISEEETKGATVNVLVANIRKNFEEKQEALAKEAKQLEQAGLDMNNLFSAGYDEEVVDIEDAHYEEEDDSDLDEFSLFNEEPE